MVTSRWRFHIDNMFMKQDITAQINVDENGEYTFYAVTKKGLQPFPSEAMDALEMKGDTFKAKISNPESPFMKIEIVVTFGEETAEGYFKLPILGKMKFDGVKVEMTDLPIASEVTEDEVKEKVAESEEKEE